jgi:hypothetical protein
MIAQAPGTGRGHQPPLCVHLFFHPESTAAAGVAMRLFAQLNGASTDFGPRIPVRFGVCTEDGRPEVPPLDSANSLVVILVDRRMARRATDDDDEVADAWTDLIENLLRTNPPNTSTDCSVLPVALDSAAFHLSERLDHRSFVRLNNHDLQHLEFHVAIRCLRLMADRPASDAGDVDTLPRSDVEVFVSHAKRDLSGKPTEGPVAALLTAHHELPLKAWYDSSQIPPGAEFAKEIDKAVKSANVVVVVLTDSYSSREWCRREVLAAKAEGRPLVVVDAIKSRVVRLFPYIGNAPTVRWRAALAEATEPSDKYLPAETLLGWEAYDAKTVLLQALFEALRYEHERARLGTGDGSVKVLGTHPEAITIAAMSADTTRVLYPDPPLGREELEYAQRARPTLELTTPLEQLAGREAPRRVLDIALSLSGAADAGRYGASDLHLATMAHDLALYLLLGGHRLIYGGSLNHGAVRHDGTAPGDDVNYVERLMELVERHYPLAREIGRPIHPIVNWVPWPRHTMLAEELDLYQYNRAKLETGRQPDDLNVDAAELERATADGFPTDTPLGRYLWARGLTTMRSDSTAAASARVAMGGKLEGYTGILPGIAEEVLLSLRSDKPVYLIGAFGGAARAVLEVLRGQSRVELTSAWCQSRVAGWSELIDEYGHRGYPVVTPEEMTEELGRRGAGGLAAALHNGLSDDANDELATTTDPWRAVHLVLDGLRAVETRDE